MRLKLYPYCIHCVDQDSGKEGCFAYNPTDGCTAGNFHAITPVFPDLQEFYDWTHKTGFGIHHGAGPRVTERG